MKKNRRKVLTAKGWYHLKEGEKAEDFESTPLADETKTKIEVEVVEEKVEKPKGRKKR